MSNNKNKELRQKCKTIKPQMGIYIIKSKSENKCFIDASANLNGALNGSRLKLDGGSFPSHDLQKAWRENGADCFKIEILDILDYDKDELKTDYRDDLDALKSAWIEKLEKEQGMAFYKRF